MTKKPGQKMLHLLPAIAATLLVACGGGGGSGGNSSGGNTDTDSSSTTISGGASKGPLDTSTIEMFDIDSAGIQVGSVAIETTTTDADGLFTLTLSGHSGHLHLLKAKGGSYVDEADQSSSPRSVIFGSTDVVLEAILLDGPTTVALTPYSNALLTKSVRETSSGDFDAIFAKNRALATAAYGFDIVTTLPADPISPASVATDHEKLYAQLLGGSANVINNIAINLGHAEPNAQIIQAFISDLSDGYMYGELNGTQIQVLDNGSTPALANISPSAQLNEEILRFRNNNTGAYGSLLVEVDHDKLSIDGGGLFWGETNWNEGRWH